MATFSVTDAAFTGFRVVREHRGAVLVWALMELLLGLVGGFAVVHFFGGAMSKMMAMRAEGEPDPAQTLVLLHQLAPLYAALIVCSLAFNAILFAAMNRVVLRPKEDFFGYLWLGGDELRQLALIVLYGLLCVAAIIAFVLVIGVPYYLFILRDHGRGTLVASVCVFLAYFAWLVFFNVRFSLASAQTFATRKVNLFGSWTLTRGKFWVIFGAYLLTGVLFLIIALLSFFLIAAIVHFLPGGDFSACFLHPDTSTISAYFTPAHLAELVLDSIVNALLLPVLLTPAPAIYGALAEDRPIEAY